MKKSEMKARYKILDETYEDGRRYNNTLGNIIDVSYAYDDIDKFRSALIKDYNNSVDMESQVCNKLVELREELTKCEKGK